MYPAALLLSSSVATHTSGFGNSIEQLTKDKISSGANDSNLI